MDFIVGSVDESILLKSKPMEEVNPKAQTNVESSIPLTCDQGQTFANQNTNSTLRLHFDLNEEATIGNSAPDSIQYDLPLSLIHI